MSHLPQQVVFCLALLWGGCVFLAMGGWGTLVNRVFMPNLRAGLGWRAAFGFALMVSLGGCLNLAGIVSRPLILVLTGGGLAALLLASRIRPPRIAPVQRIRAWLPMVLYASVYALAAVLYAGASFGPLVCGSFNCHDDFQAYFVFPVKLLQLGSIGSDPFNLRLLTALGGQTFLHTFVLAALPPECLSLLDGGIGIILVIAVLAGYTRKAGASALGGAFVLLAFLLIGAPVANITSLFIALGLFLSLFRILDCDSAGTGKALLVSLHVAALCSLKFSRR